ncbi:hypothetical protein AFUB_044520 [Aspergillus fumigatus A1163]|uniref:Uncharacterized protein n=1 Tax=Aspergillus fumigatus (strain CBS 144.89 / FGSC A1163 / CEA10) TaxID=451804 RepID=B0XZM1_ASPFC|nr:hypothetical protein AFUB_044520 [Aspergillus fumigatus A1163]
MGTRACPSGLHPPRKQFALLHWVRRERAMRVRRLPEIGPVVWCVWCCQPHSPSTRSPF